MTGDGSDPAATTPTRAKDGADDHERKREGEPAVNDGDGPGDTEAHPLVAAYRHDVHKLRGRRHAAAANHWAGVPVNEAVPLGADRDAALLSRPRGDPEQTVANHQFPARLSLLTGAPTTDQTDGDQQALATDEELRTLVRPTADEAPDPARLHATWLTSPVPARVNEAVHYPYTSLKYHTLLTAALLAAYRQGNAFDDLALVATHPGAAVGEEDEDIDGVGGGERGADSPYHDAHAGPGAGHDHYQVGAPPATPEAALAAPAVRPHETILYTPVLALHLRPTLTPDTDGPQGALVGTEPSRSFAATWRHLPSQPLPTDERWAMCLDAQLRRIRSWSTALQYIDEFVARHAPGADDASRQRPGSGQGHPQAGTQSDAGATGTQRQRDQDPVIRDPESPEREPAHRQNRRESSSRNGGGQR